MRGNGRAPGGRVDRRQVAGRAMRAHQPMHQLDGTQGLADGVLKAGVVQPGGRNLDVSAEQGAHAPHGRPFRARSYMTRIRLTPAVRCLDDSVAPEMFLMSALSFSREATDLPANCWRHAGSRTS